MGEQSMKDYKPRKPISLSVALADPDITHLRNPGAPTMTLDEQIDFVHAHIEGYRKHTLLMETPEIRDLVDKLTAVMDSLIDKRDAASEPQASLKPIETGQFWYRRRAVSDTVCVSNTTRLLYKSKNIAPERLIGFTSMHDTEPHVFYATEVNFRHMFTYDPNQTSGAPRTP